MTLHLASYVIFNKYRKPTVSGYLILPNATQSCRPDFFFFFFFGREILFTHAKNLSVPY